MKKLLIMTLIFASATQLYAQNLKKVKIKTAEDSISYAIGVNIASSLKKQDMNDLNPLAIGKAINDLFQGEEIIKEKDADKMIQTYFMKLQEEKRNKNESENIKFFEKNAEKDGIVVHESGLQYEIIEEGTGETPKITDKVKVHYEGTLLDGTKFDSSYDRGEPAVFGITQVIKGWTQALMLMKEGATWIVYLPSNLAYGERGAGEDIKPFSALIFKIELISIEK